MKRRQFTTSIALLAAWFTTPGTAALAAMREPSGQVSGLTRECFERRIGHRFTVHGPADSTLRLAGIDSAVPGCGREQFHVVFNSPEGDVLPEGVYALETGGKTEFCLHLQPGEPGRGLQRMVATINLQRSA